MPSLLSRYLEGVGVPRSSSAYPSTCAGFPELSPSDHNMYVSSFCLVMPIVVAQERLVKAKDFRASPSPALPPACLPSAVRPQTAGGAQRTWERMSMAHSGHEGKAKGCLGYPEHYFARHSPIDIEPKRTHSECTLVTLSRTTKERRSQGIDPGGFDRAIPPERVVPWRARGQLCSVLFPRGRPSSA